MMKKPPHPGELLGEDVLGELELTVAEAAARLGVSRVMLSRVIHGHSRVGPDLAIRLERAGVGTALAWMAMQTNYDLARELDGKTHDVQPLVVA
jgi:antitoxin HigA-1